MNEETGHKIYELSDRLEKVEAKLAFMKEGVETFYIDRAYDQEAWGFSLITTEIGDEVKNISDELMALRRNASPSPKAEGETREGKDAA